jgi:hypothetical protein
VERFLAYATVPVLVAMFEVIRQSVNIITKRDMVVLFTINLPINTLYITILSEIYQFHNLSSIVVS